jgi:peptide deformylase
MAVRPIRFFGDPILRSPCDPIDPLSERARLLVADLIDTVKEPGRAGVAANQIGVGLRAFSYNVDGEVESVEGEPELVDEGCLSVPGLSYPRRRYPRATVKGVLLDGSDVTLSGEGLMAQALQHECDHLDGHLYIEGLEPDAKREAMAAIRESDWFQRP